ncbi:hypothetical protein LCM10_11240 [Rossellomorea aquimaris]|uniref:hypothetical protein n=1 Tax=Rossellomorea aquimaris TaxID=189382 RepID=UPI001CD758AE|nr:hypothetical protein [Rossellomorea aquimaris]MCA1055560.1 hypothetical protein [Rossellomorea aquimaris]
MLIGRTLYITGLIAVAFSIITFIMTLGSTGNELLYSFFGFLNGLLAMGVGELVIDSNHRKNTTKEML